MISYHYLSTSEMGYYIYARIGVCVVGDDGKQLPISKDKLKEIQTAIDKDRKSEEDGTRNTDDISLATDFPFLDSCKWMPSDNAEQLSSMFPDLRFVFAWVGEDENDDSYFFIDCTGCTIPSVRHNESYSRIPNSKNINNKEKQLIIYKEKQDKLRQEIDEKIETGKLDPKDIEDLDDEDIKDEDIDTSEERFQFRLENMKSFIVSIGFTDISEMFVSKDRVLPEINYTSSRNVRDTILIYKILDKYIYGQSSSGDQRFNVNTDIIGLIAEYDH